MDIVNKLDPLTEFVYWYFEFKDLYPPTLEEACQFIATEVGELNEVLVSRNFRWKRNNPQDKHDYSPEHLAHELGDIIYMCIIAGRAAGVDPVAAIYEKRRP
jgi:NTP pyrophosphatase (non-canonical NTP hydrolase)